MKVYFYPATSYLSYGQQLKWINQSNSYFDLLILVSSKFTQHMIIVAAYPARPVYKRAGLPWLSRKPVKA